ncbi:MAG: hypothetical protein QMD32_05590 [Smithellaceae bacterium]|nr:hypothetical protein [Smithellaceae bacterium]
MRLSLLLLALDVKLRRAAKVNKAFRNYIGIVKLRILIKTSDGKYGRLFVFDRGKFSSERAASQPFDAALVWADPRIAFKVMTSGRDEATFLAAADGKLKVEGMAYYIQWFNEAVKLAL